MHILIYMPCEDSNRLTHLQSLISIFAVHMKKLLILDNTWSVLQRIWSASLDSQADLSLHWAHKGKGTFSHITAKVSNPSSAHISRYSNILFRRKVLNFFLFLHKNICCRYSVEATHEVLLMSTHNICFCGEIRKILCGYPSYLEIC